jgi:glycosyltransferase involved in cell wall biosynthesis
VSVNGRPLRILHVIDQLTGGGAEVSLVEYLTHARGNPAVEHAIVILNGQLESLAVAETLSIPVTAGSPGRRPRWSDAGLISSAVAEFEPDVVHCALVRSTLGVARSLRGTRIPMLVTLTSVHYDVEDTDGTLKKRWGIRLTHALHGMALRRDRVWFHAVAQSVAEKAIEVFDLDPARIAVVPRGRPDPLARVTEDRESVRRSLGVADSAPVLISVAREHQVKNPLALVDAAEQLMDEFADLTVLIVGPRSTASEDLDERLLGSALETRVLRLGYRQDIPNLLAASDMFVSTSRSEGLPGAIVEAIGVGLPVVAFDVPGVPDVLGPDHPGLVPFGDLAAMTRQIRSILTDPSARDQVSRLDRKLFEESFEIGSYSERLHAIYRRVADGSPSRPTPTPDMATISNAEQGTEWTS